MRTDRKARVQTLAGDLQRSNSPEAHAVKELLQLLLDDVKDALVTTSGEGTLLAQGEAQSLTRTLTLLTRAPANIVRKMGDQQ